MTTIESPESVERYANQQLRDSDAKRSLKMRAFLADAAAMRIASMDIPVHSPEQLAAVLLAIGSHNSYDAEDAARSLAPMVERCSAVTVRHCADGPYITFQLPYWTYQALAWRYRDCPTAQRRKLTEADRIELAMDVIRRGKGLLADSIRVRQNTVGRDPAAGPEVVQGTPGDDPYEITLWWD